MPTDIKNHKLKSNPSNNTSLKNVEMEKSMSEINFSQINLPRHVAIIMDGNGRWANIRGKKRTYGHEAGVKAARNIIDEAIKLGIKNLTLFGFSSENWKRPKDEVSELMNLLKMFLKKDLFWVHKRNIKLRIIGSDEGVESKIVKYINNAHKLTKNNTNLNLVVAFNYGGRGEIVRTVKDIAKKVSAGQINIEQIEEETISSHLDTSGVCYPDLLIRTGGEQRISNFLLWQIAYSELLFVDALWPDFNKDEFKKALYEYHLRERRFGGLSEVQSTAAE